MKEQILHTKESNMQHEEISYLEDLNSLYSVDAGIRLEHPSFEVFMKPEDLSMFEAAARTCYKSEGKIGPDSDKNLFDKLLKINHMAMAEFVGDIVVKLYCSRAVTHEVVRARLFSFAQLSQRYVSMDKEDVQFVLPGHITAKELFKGDHPVFIRSCINSANDYRDRIAYGEHKQTARGSLNNDCYTEIWMKANFREWMHTFGLRMDSAAHRDYRMLMCGIYETLLWDNPDLYSMVADKYSLHKNISWFKDTFDIIFNNNRYSIVAKASNEHS